MDAHGMCRAAQHSYTQPLLWIPLTARHSTLRSSKYTCVKGDKPLKLVKLYLTFLKIIKIIVCATKDECER